MIVDFRVRVFERRVRALINYLNGGFLVVARRIETLTAFFSPPPTLSTRSYLPVLFVARFHPRRELRSCGDESSPVKLKLSQLRRDGVRRFHRFGCSRRREAWHAITSAP